MDKKQGNTIKPYDAWVFQKVYGAENVQKALFSRQQVYVCFCTDEVYVMLLQARHQATE